MLRSRSQLVCRIGNITTNCSMLHVANCCLGVRPPLATKQPTRFFQLIYFSIKFLKLYLGFKAFLLLKTIKKRGNRKRSPISTTTLIFYAAHDRWNRPHGPHLVSPKEKKNSNRKRSRAAD
jgi:hypothetical protein